MSENPMDWEQHEGEEIMTEVYFIGWANTFKGYIQKKFFFVTLMLFQTCISFSPLWKTK